MALKAGRVGLNKDLVDEFGYLKEDAPSGEYYTKTQADNKFETKTHVNNNFQKKTLEVPIELLSGSALTVESALQGINEEKQNMTLEVPIELLSGSALTVEDALQGLNRELTDELVVQESVVTDVVADATIVYSGTRLRKLGKLVEFALRLNNVTANAFSSLAIVPEGYRPRGTVYFTSKIVGEDTLYTAQVDNNGVIQFPKNLTDNSIIFYQITWIVN